MTSYVLAIRITVITAAAAAAAAPAAGLGTENYLWMSQHILTGYEIITRNKNIN